MNYSPDTEFVTLTQTRVRVEELERLRCVLPSDAIDDLLECDAEVHGCRDHLTFLAWTEEGL